MRRHKFLLDHGLPVDICAPGVGLNASNLSLGDAFTRVFVEHQLEQVGQLLRDELPRVFQLLVEGTHEHFVLIS